jgi:outer membrane protein TolC
MNLTGRGFLALKCSLLIAALFTNTHSVFAQTTMTLEQILEIGLNGKSSVGFKQGAYETMNAKGAVQAAEGLFDWTLRSATGYRHLPVPVAAGDFLTTGTDYKTIHVTHTSVGKLFENGIRVRPGMQMVSGASSMQLNQQAMRTQPTLEVDVPLGSAWGAPPERLRLDAARANFDATKAIVERQKQVHLARLFKSSWALLAAQKKQAVCMELHAIADEFAGRAIRLGKAGALSGRHIDLAIGRANQARFVLEQTQSTRHVAQLELALLLGADPDRIGELVTPFPMPIAGLDNAALEQLLSTALMRRVDLQAELSRIQAARQQSKAILREADSALSLQLTQDRLMVSWVKPLGSKRDLGAQEQAEAVTSLAELRKDELVQRIEMEVRIAARRFQEVSPAILRTQELVGRLHAHVGQARLALESGFDPAGVLLDQAERWSSAAQHLIDLELSHALALVDLHLASPTAMDEGLVPAKLVRIYANLPIIP